VSRVQTLMQTTVRIGKMFINVEDENPLSFTAAETGRPCLSGREIMLHKMSKWNVPLLPHRRLLLLCSLVFSFLTLSLSSHFSGIVSQILLFIFLLLLLSAVAGFKRLPGSNCCSERPKRRTEEEEDEDLHF
jgi:hypothetical protein